MEQEGDATGLLNNQKNIKQIFFLGILFIRREYLFAYYSNTVFDNKEQLKV